jgi:hypothetical protein
METLPSRGSKHFWFSYILVNYDRTSFFIFFIKLFYRKSIFWDFMTQNMVVVMSRNRENIDFRFFASFNADLGMCARYWLKLMNMKTWTFSRKKLIRRFFKIAFILQRLSFDKNNVNIYKVWVCGFVHLEVCTMLRNSNPWTSQGANKCIQNT